MDNEEAIKILDAYFGDLVYNKREEAWQTLKTAVLAKQTNNKQSMPPVKCEVCKAQDAVVNVCYDCYMAT